MQKKNDMYKIEHSMIFDIKCIILSYLPLEDIRTYLESKKDKKLIRRLQIKHGIYTGKDRDENMVKKYYYLGQIHRNKLPAIIVYNKDGSVQREYFYQYGRLAKYKNKTPLIRIYTRSKRIDITNIGGRYGRRTYRMYLLKCYIPNINLCCFQRTFRSLEDVFEYMIRMNMASL